MWKPTDLDNKQLLVVFLAIILSNVFYLLPFVGVARSFRERKPLPCTPYFYSLSMINTLIWCCYGFIVPDPFFIGSEMLGSIATTYYFIVALAVEGGRGGRAGTERFVIFHTAQVTIIMLVFFYAQWMYVKIEKILGWAGNIWSIAMLWSPIVDTLEAWKSKDADIIFLPISVLTVINSCIWMSYGLWLGLIYVWSPSILTLISGMVQVGVYLIITGKKTMLVEHKKEITCI
ncbi:hypothetical protein [Dishui Lake large algae virus 1]|nr:hypothetical protein [Dishui Lake large algae virus 1]